MSRFVRLSPLKLTLLTRDLMSLSTNVTPTSESAIVFFSTRGQTRCDDLFYIVSLLGTFGFLIFLLLRILLRFGFSVKRQSHRKTTKTVCLFTQVPRTERTHSSKQC